MDALTKLLQTHGPRRSSRLRELLCEDGSTPEAARKRLSRAKPPILSYPFSLLPDREAFFYLKDERGSERYWTNFIDALRETDTVYAAALDGLAARGGIVALEEFPVISGAPSKQQNQVPHSLVLKRLEEAGFLRQMNRADLGTVVQLEYSIFGPSDHADHRARQVVERVMLDGVREWARKLGLASWNSIAIRGEDHPRMIGPYKWDLSGPSYLMPLRSGSAELTGQGFLAADVFAGETIDHNQIRYIVRKARALRFTTRVGRVLPMIVAQGFTPEALTAGRKAGLMMATPATLFGTHVARALNDLLSVLNRAAETVIGNPDKLASLIEDLSDIEGKAGNLRGILFELMVAFLVRYDGSSIDMGRRAYDADRGREAEIDILRVKGRAEAVAFECKGKAPGGTVSVDEVDDWLRRIPIFRDYIRAQQTLSEADLRFELWTSGTFEPDALKKLEDQKHVRTRTPIDWKDGQAVRDHARGLKESRITKTFDEHFFRHPLNQ